uniref:Bm7049, isoform b n=1 Tax=Brugia malayi TaxID=6279 RepID=A0A1I9G072_BRUMA|nr:Bm7049, isoform b [Brugia malayi]
MINSWKIIVGIRVICCDMQFMQITVFFLDRGNEVLQKIFSKTLLLLKRCAPKISFKLLKLKIENMKKKSMKISSDRAFIFQTVAEYRNECRNEISEWFATLNRLEGAEWLIVFDSMKAREQKNRGALMERIKSDFSKFTNSLSRLYQSLGMFEQVLALFDELDATLSLIALHHSSEGTVQILLNLEKED